MKRQTRAIAGISLVGRKGEEREREGKGGGGHTVCFISREISRGKRNVGGEG